MSKYLICELIPENLDEIKYIKDNIGIIYDISWDKNQFLYQINNSNTKTYIFKSNNEILGFVCFNICLDEAEILNICINKKHNNKGLGHYLLQNTINKLKSRNISKIFLEVNVNNIFAIKLYKKNEFKIISTRKDYYLNKTTNTKDDAYVMTKIL